MKYPEIRYVFYILNELCITLQHEITFRAFCGKYETILLFYLEGIIRVIEAINHFMQIGSVK